MSIDVHAATAGHLGGLDLSSADAESVALAALLSQARLAPLTRDIVRKAIAQALENGRELDRLQAEFGSVGTILDGYRDGYLPGGTLQPCYEQREQVLANKIDHLRRTLGALNG